MKSKNSKSQKPLRRRVHGELAMDVCDAAAFYGCSEKALRSRVARGLIPYKKIGKRILFSREELTEFFKAQPGVSLEEALENVRNRES